MVKKQRPTLQDIAQSIGITKMTVSRYLRDPNSVAKETAIKIAQAIETFGYIPSRAPQILANAKSKAIGVLVPSLTNQVFAEVIKGIEMVTDPAGYQTMLAHYGYNEKKEEERIESLLSYHIDGIILSENQHTERTKRMLSIANIPVIEIMESSQPGLQQVIGFDNFVASKSMTEQLIARKRKNIVYFAARMDYRTKLKMDGYVAAMHKHDLTPQQIITEEASSFSLGSQQLQLALEKYPNIDGIICTNDDLAIGAIFESQRLGINIPNKIAIAGFHGHDVGQTMSPRLATVIHHA